MASKTSHVLLRDGSANRGGPRPTWPSHAVKRGQPNDVSAAFGGRYTEDTTVGRNEIGKATFDKIGTGRTPRDELAQSKPQPANPSDGKALGQGLPAPID